MYVSLYSKRKSGAAFYILTKYNIQRNCEQAMQTDWRNLLEIKNFGARKPKTQTFHSTMVNSNQRVSTFKNACAGIRILNNHFFYIKWAKN